MRNSNGFSEVKMKYLIGIDPGVQIGFALWDCIKKKFVAIQTYNIHQFRQNLEVYAKMFPGEVGAYLEASDMKEYIWHREGRPLPTSPIEIRKLLKLARNVGLNQGSAREIRHLLEWYEVPITNILPGTSPTKVTPQFFQSATGWREKVTSHAMDAAMLIVGRTK